MVLLIIVGVALVALAIYYWVTPAGSLPSFFPGHLAGSAHKHIKHGLAAGIVASSVSWGPGCCPAKSRSVGATSAIIENPRKRGGFDRGTARPFRLVSSILATTLWAWYPSAANALHLFHGVGSGTRGLERLDQGGLLGR